MDSDLGEEQYSQHFQLKEQMNTAGGLTRYRSAPSSYLSSFMDAGDLCEPHPQPRPLSPETESILARFMENVAEGGNDSTPHKLYGIPENSALNQPPLMGSVKHEVEQTTQTIASSGNNNRSTTNNNYQQNSNSIESNFRLPNSGSRTNSNLMRHTSSPAGLFDDIIIENVNKETGNYGSNSQINFSSGESAGVSDAVRSWDDSAISTGKRRAAGLLSHHLSLPKASIEKLLKFEESVPCKMRAKRGFATHPRSIAERVRRTKISDRMRKLQDLVPNMDKVPTYTHCFHLYFWPGWLLILFYFPGSQQTNTSDMLDFAVDYIKQLQNQVTTLADKRDKCTCTSLEQP